MLESTSGVQILKKYTDGIEAASPAKALMTKQHLDSIAKPLNSLGLLEDVLVGLGAAGCLKRSYKKCVAVMCADNGVVEEGVTQTDSSITALVAKNMLSGISSVCTMAKCNGVDVFPIDVGMLTEIAGVRVRKTQRGTGNIRKCPAMTNEQAVSAVLAGIDTVRELKDKGYDMIAAAEMGIGNTTTTSAVLSVMLDIKPESVTGRGAGLSDTGLANKINVIKDAISLNKPDRNDVLDVLAKVGGFDIAGMAGLFIGGAYYKVPVIIDGIISSAAALAAVQLAPLCRDYMIASHVSAEPAAKAVMEKLELKPLLNIGMALGEGTGAVSIMPIIDMALAMYYDMPTFAEFGMQEYKKL